MSQPTPSPPPRRKARRCGRWIAAVGLVPLIVAGVAFFFGESLAVPLIRWRLQQMVDSQLNAELRIGGLTYAWPYGVEVNDAALVAAGPDGKDVDLFKLPRMRLMLARLPFHSGPLVIREIILDEPSVHLIKTATGLVGRRDLIRTSADTRPTRTGARYRLSEMFELRRVAIVGGKAVYQDLKRPQTVPLVWKNLDAELRTNPATNPIYTFNFTGRNAAVGSAEASGSFNIDERDVMLDRLRITAKVDPADKESPLPGPLQQALATYQVRGQLTIDATGRAPLRRPEETRMDVLVTSDRLSITDRELTATDIGIHAIITPGNVELVAGRDLAHGLQLQALGGQVWGDGRLTPGDAPGYHFDAEVKDLDLKQLDEALTKPGQKPVNLSGRGNLRLALDGSGRDLGGHGEFELLDGELLNLPVLSKLTSMISSSRAGGSDQAAGLFVIEPDKVRFTKLAASNPMIGIQGSGDVWFDKRLDLQIVVAPLADWKKHLQKTGIPLLGDIGANLAGEAQKLLNTATGKLLFHYRITGTIDDPTVSSEASELPRDALKLFTDMAEKADKGLLEKLK